mmetsp:Transcript_63501/g.175025  ORF Transcript_63501/g.175025 Transcript_63501/m.175025 type:complete len:225 (-) Transcript_63501:183-857(-)
MQSHRRGRVRSRKWRVFAGRPNALSMALPATAPPALAPYLARRRAAAGCTIFSVACITCGSHTAPQVHVPRRRAGWAFLVSLFDIQNSNSKYPPAAPGACGGPCPQSSCTDPHSPLDNSYRLGLVSHDPVYHDERKHHEPDQVNYKCEEQAWFSAWRGGWPRMRNARCWPQAAGRWRLGRWRGGNVPMCLLPPLFSIVPSLPRVSFSKPDAEFIWLPMPSSIRF